MRLAFFGAEGNVGRALVPVLERAGHDVSGFEIGDELDVRGLDAAVDFTMPDARRACGRRSTGRLVRRQDDGQAGR